jgi:hypothetical protein
MTTRFMTTKDMLDFIDKNREGLESNPHAIMTLVGEHCDGFKEIVLGIDKEGYVQIGLRAQHSLRDSCVPRWP